MTKVAFAALLASAGMTTAAHAIVVVDRDRVPVLDIEMIQTPLPGAAGTVGPNGEATPTIISLGNDYYERTSWLNQDVITTNSSNIFEGLFEVVGGQNLRNTVNAQGTFATIERTTTVQELYSDEGPQNATPTGTPPIIATEVLAGPVVTSMSLNRTLSTDVYAMERDTVTTTGPMELQLSGSVAVSAADISSGYVGTDSIRFAAGSGTVTYDANTSEMTINRSYQSELQLDANGLVTNGLVSAGVVSAQALYLNDVSVEDLLVGEATSRAAADEAETIARILGDEAEAAARVAADAELATVLVTESTARIAADTELAAGLVSEASARMAADSAIAESVTAEASARVAGDEAEATARMTADAELATGLLTEANARVAGDEAEASARIAADTELAAGLASEAGVRSAADVALGERVTLEEQQRVAADSAILESVSTEASARVAADAALGARMDGIEGRVAGLESRFRNMDNRIDSSAAVAIAMGGASFLPDMKFNLAANVATYNGAQAFSASLGARITRNVAITAAFGTGLNKGGKAGGRAGFVIGF